MPIFRLSPDLVFPHPSNAEEDILAIGGDLSPQRLLLAYSNGIFPWYNKNEPIIWWSPDPRLLLFLEKFKVSKSLRQSIRNRKYEIRMDTNFEGVIDGCANTSRKYGDGTWIVPEMRTAYIRLHKLGFAHSIETYDNDQLVGGLYGVSLGRIFCGESMFAIARDASKVAMYHLVEQLKVWDFTFIDAQTSTDHLISLGAEEISRDKFLILINDALNHETKQGKWSFDQNLFDKICKL